MPVMSGPIEGPLTAPGTQRSGMNGGASWRGAASGLRDPGDADTRLPTPYVRGGAGGGRRTIGRVWSVHSDPSQYRSVRGSSESSYQPACAVPRC